jgi:hypothetical protein
MPSCWARARHHIGISLRFRLTRSSTICGAVRPNPACTRTLPRSTATWARAQFTSPDATGPPQARRLAFVALGLTARGGFSSIGPGRASVGFRPEQSRPATASWYASQLEASINRRCIRRCGPVISSAISESSSRFASTHRQALTFARHCRRHKDRPTLLMSAIEATPKIV